MKAIHVTQGDIFLAWRLIRIGEIEELSLFEAYVVWRIV
ncbi:Protein of unknown function [Bacillus cereus]|nr:Protein of unknown function [Bacillus cereus]